MPHPNGEPTEEEKQSFYSGFEWKAPKRPTGQMTTDGLRYMALTYLHLLEQNSGDDDDIRVMYAISMHPKIKALLSRSGEIVEAGK